MGKKKGGRKSFSKKPQEVFDSDDERAYASEKQPDKKDASFYLDDVDTFHENRDKLLLERGAEIKQAEESSDNEDEVLGIGSDSEDEMAIEEYERQLKKFKNYDFKDDLASDLEDEKEDLPDDKAWGSARDKFYGADVGDNLKLDSGDEADAALLEEQEAIAIQKRMAEELDDQDFDLDIFKTVKNKESLKKSSKEDLKEEKIEKDLSQLTKSEKLKILTKESPELLQLIDDYKDKVKELQERILPIQSLIRKGKLPKSNGAEYIEAKVRLYLNYCINISFYMMLKAKRTPVQNHPVIKRIVQYRNLIKQMEAIDSKVSNELEDLLDKINSGREDFIPGKTQETFAKRAKTKAEKRKKKLSEMAEGQSDSEGEEEQLLQPKKSKKLDKAEGRYETKGEKAALEYYKMMKAGRKNDSEDDEDDDEEEVVNEEEIGDEAVAEEDDGDVEEDEELTDGKRAITYQIAKNKGLTPKRKKEQRNPRVKHREKFRKAKIRRKGQVREVRKEISKYGGEISGIKASVSRSVKFK